MKTLKAPQAPSLKLRRTRLAANAKKARNGRFVFWPDAEKWSEAEKRAFDQTRLYVAQPGDDGFSANAPMMKQGFAPSHTAPGFSGDLRTMMEVMSRHASQVSHMASHRQGRKMTGQEVAKNELTDFLQDVVKSLEDKGATEKSSELLAEAREALRVGNPRKMLQLCELRKENINNYVRARSHFLDIFFETVTLGQNDSAQIVNETMYPQAVFYMAQDGKLRLQRAVAGQTNWLVPLYFIATQKYGYQIEDIQRGNVTSAAMKTVDIGWDLAQQKDKNAYLALTGGLSRASQNGGVNGIFGPFVTQLTNPSYANTTGYGTAAVGPQLWTFNPTPSIQQSLLPTTNALTPTQQATPTGLSTGRLAGMLLAPDGSPVLGFGFFQAIIKYCDQFGDIWPDGKLRPTGMVIVPAIDATSTLYQVSATAAKPSQVAEGLLSDYTRFEYGGIVWTLVPDNTIPRGTAYAVLNKPVGKNYIKPSMEREFVNTDFEGNWEDRWYRGTQGLYIPVQHTPRACSVTYQ